MMKKRSYRQLAKISPATLLEESDHIKLILRAVMAVAVIIILLIVWSALTTIQETATTFGELVPVGHVQVLQHLEGGIISQVLVSNGDAVKKGQVLVKFDPTATRAELASLQSREIALLLNQHRLHDYLNNKQANIADWSKAVIGSKYNKVNNPEKIRNLLEDEKQHLASQFKQRQDQLSILRATVKRLKEKYYQTMKQQEVWAKHLDLLKKEFNMYQELRTKQLIAHKDYLVILRDLNRAEGEAISLKSQAEQVRQEIYEAVNKFKESDSKLREDALAELGNANDQLLEVRHKIEKLEAQISRMNITSPVDGAVQGVKVSVGNVVQPGGILMEIVPVNEALVVESRVDPRDIGFIRIGDSVDVKILTYDFARYGSVSGKLTDVSASTFLDKEGKPYYKATIKLAQQYVGKAKQKNRLLAGMTVEASIITGKKTLLQYMLKPIHLTSKYAFHER